MKGVNKAIILGNLGNDPEVKTLQDGKTAANISVATSEEWLDKKTNNKQSRVEWHRIVFFGAIAEVVGRYLKKGSKVYVEGSIRTRKWQDKDGRDCYTTEIIADSMQMLDSKPKDAPQAQNAPSSQGFQSFNDDFEDDIPNF